MKKIAIISFILTVFPFVQAQDMKGLITVSKWKK